MTNLTQIQLVGNAQGYLNTDENVVFPLNFAVSDIRDITKKKGTFSKSITLPGTKNNNKLLNNYFDVNIESGSFDIKRTQYCDVIQNGITILENAILQLISINKVQGNNNADDMVTYTVLIKDSTSDFFNSINNLYLTDLSGFTYMNHIYTAENVISSFTNDWTNGYKYILPFNPDPTINNFDDAVYSLKEMKPGIYAKVYVDKIFAAAGYSYYWPEMSDNLVEFDKLIIPWNGDSVLLNQIDDIQYLVEANYSGNTIQLATPRGNFGYYTALYSLTNPIILNVETNDQNNNYNPTTGIYTIPDLTGVKINEEIEFEVDYELTIDNQSGHNAYLGSILRYNTFQYTQYNENVGYDNIPMQVIPEITVGLNGIIDYSYQIPFKPVNAIIQQKTAIPSGITVLQSGTGTNSITLSSDLINAGHILSFNTSLIVNSIINGVPSSSLVFDFLDGINVGANQLTNVNIKLNITGVRMKIQPKLTGEYDYNIPVEMSNYIPDKIKQADFLKSIMTMYNAYVEVDKYNPKQLNIKSRDAYYDDGKINNWSKKLVKDQDQTLTFLPDLLSKKIIMTYKADSDYANKFYTDATKEIYGQVEYTFDSDYVKNITKNELIFSPTPMGNTSFGAICPLWDGFTPKNNLRILIDGGAYELNNGYTYSISNNDILSVSTNTYPHISHWNKPYNPTFDINFALCDRYFRTDNWGANTNNNLFNLYWRRTFNQINNGKMLTAYFNLTPYDIQNMSLSDKVYIDNSWWNINQIIDYNANALEPTKVELISIDDNLKIPFLSRTVFTTQLDSNLLQVYNNISTDRLRHTNTILSKGAVNVIGSNNHISKDINNVQVLGDNNTMLASNSFVVGHSNTVNNNSAVFGNNNNIQESSHNIVIIGNNFNIDPTSNNTLYTDNLHIPSGGTVNGQPANNVFANTYTTGATFNNTTNTLLLNNNSGSSITTQITSMSGLTLTNIPTSALTTNNVLFLNPSGGIESIAFSALTNLIMEKELIIKCTFIYGGINTYAVIKDDLGYGTGLTLGLSDNGENYPSTSTIAGHYLIAEIIFPSANIANKLIIKDYE